MRCTRAPRRWTGWRRSRSAASRSRPPRRRRCGTTIASTSSIRPGTWTLRSRSSGACASSTAPSPSSTPSPASSPSPRPSGGRPTSTRCRGSRSSTRWTAPAPISSPPCSRWSTASARTRSRSSSRSAQEDLHRGVIDLVEMKAIVYKDDLGEEFETTDIPAELAEQAHEYHHQLVDAVVQLRRRGARRIPRGRVLGDRRHAQARHPCCDARRRDHAGAARQRVQEQGRAAAARRRDRLSAEPARRARDPGHRPEDRGRALARSVPRRAVQRARLQGDVRPLRRQAHLLPGLLGQDQGRRPRPQHDHRQDRADRPHPADARQPPRGACGDRCRRHRCGRRPQVDDDGRHARGRERPDRARVDDLPRPGDRGRRRAEVEGRPGQARQRPRPPRRGGSDLPRRVRRGDRPDPDLGHGRAPPRDHRRPPQARIQRRRERRPPAGRLPRDDRQAGRAHPGQVRQADGRLAASTATP